MTVATKERPIIFSAPMIRAILEGRKTQTRRMVKPQPTKNIGVPGTMDRDDWAFPNRGLSWTVTNKPHGPDGWIEENCPFPVGTRLWVREAWCQPFKRSKTETGVIYRVDGPEYMSAASAVHQWGKEATWKSPIHMPRWASRITLEVTGVKVERVQDISEADAISEGMKPRPQEPYDCMDDPREQYRFLWDAINGKGSWAANPWVWAYTFRRVEP